MSQIANDIDAALAARFGWPTEARRPWGFWATAAWGLGAFGLWMAASLLTYMAEASGQITAVGSSIVACTIIGSAMILPLIVIAIRYTGQPWREYLALRRLQGIDALIGIACLLFLGGAYVVMNALLGGDSLTTPPVEVYLILLGNGMLLPFVLAGIVIAPILEEVVFRGFLYRGWSLSALGVAGTIVLTSLLWAAMHTRFGPGGMLMIFCVGLLLGTVRWLSGSTTLVIGIHMANNFYVLAQGAVVMTPAL